MQFREKRTIPLYGGKFLSIILATLMLFVFSVPSVVFAADDEEIPEIQTVKAGFFAFEGYHDIKDDVKSGYGYDFLQLVSRYSDINFEYVGYDKSWDEMLEMLQNGEIDLVSSASKTAEREKLFDYSLPIGRKSVHLNVRADDDRFVTNDYGAFDGMTIGLLKGNSKNEAVEEFAKTNNFTFTAKYYKTDSNLAAGLKNGEVDAVATSSLRRTVDEKTVSEFSYDDYYVIVKKGNTQLLNEINNAIIEMDNNEGNWQDTLYKKYYSAKYSQRQSFTAREKKVAEEYRNGKVLKIAVNPLNEPYSFIEDGEMVGIIPEIFDSAMKGNGMKYEFIIPKTIDEYMDLYINKEADIILDAVSDANIQESRGYIVTNDYMTLNVAKLNKTGFFGVPDSVGFVVHQQYADAIATGNAEVKYYKNFDKLCKAVETGEVDVAYLHTFNAQEYINKNGATSLTYSIVPDLEYPVKMAVNNEIHHEVCSILNKGLSRVSDEHKLFIVNEYTSYSADDAMSFATWVKNHPAGLAAIIALLVAILLIITFLQLRNKESRKHQEALQIQTNKAEAASAAKTKFLFNMSHDIRTPMNAIIGFTDIAQRHITDTELVEESLEKVKMSSEYLLGIINDILDMSKIESGKLEIEETICPIGKGTLLNLIRADAERKGVNFHTSYDFTDQYIWEDEGRVNQIVANLLSNAIKYTDRGGDVWYSFKQLPCDREGYGRFVVTVKDNGHGMNPEFVEKVFEAFERDKEAVTSGAQGTGLGMAIVKRLADAMGAELDIQSELGVGTTVTMTIEHRIATAEEIEQYERESGILETDKEESFVGKKVLVVEDNDLNREIVTDLLEEQGIVVESAEDGSEAVYLLRDKGPDYYDFILMDVQMPIMNGYEATREIRGMYPYADLPIIAVSANAFEEDKKASKEAGMDDHIAKPINIKELFETLTRFM